MQAVRYDTFEGPLRLVDVPDPTPTPDGVVVRVGAAGTVIETGKDVLK
jgi:alcohol dehydrogenase